MTSVFKTLFWVKDVFAAEFGNSDVQSNYSRLYAWMANQLGHMTLGLATALAYVWIYETLHDLAAYDSGSWFAGWGALLLNFAGFVMLVGQFLGARMGSRLVLSKGQKLIRPMIVIVSAVMSAKLLYDSHGQEILHWLGMN